MHKYLLTMAIDGTYTVEVEAEDFESAKEKADALYDADKRFDALDNAEREYIWYSEDGDSHDIV